MSKITKIIKVTGICKNCGKENSANVRTSGMKGTTGDWIGKGKCGKCQANVILSKTNVKF